MHLDRLSRWCDTECIEREEEMKPDFSDFTGKLTELITSFRVTKEEYDFVDGLAQEAGLGDGVRKGHHIVMRKAIAALKREIAREKKRAKAKKKESDE